MTAHEWQTGWITGATTCARCLLMPLDDDDMQSDCDPGDVCPACGDPIDYCQGHGEIGDYHGARILDNHDAGRHRDCHSRANCEG